MAAEALRNVELIAQEWIETARELGRPVPEPKVRFKVCVKKPVFGR